MSINSFNNEVFPLVMLIWETNFKSCHYIRIMFIWSLNNVVDFSGGSVVKNPPAMQEMFKTLVPSLGRKILWRRRWQPTPVFLPGKSHGQSSLVGYSPWGPKWIGRDLVTKQQKIPLMLGLSETFISNIFSLSL